jgi:hypothetical protein
MAQAVQVNRSPERNAMTNQSPEQQSTGTGARISVTGSTVSGSQLTAVSGDGNWMVTTNQPQGTKYDAALAAAQLELSNRLAGIREVLLEHRDPALATDRDDAMEAVTALQADLGKPVITDRKTLRQRIKALVGALRPVAEIVGGIAALEAIARGL